MRFELSVAFGVFLVILPGVREKDRRPNIRHHDGSGRESRGLLKVEALICIAKAFGQSTPGDTVSLVRLGELPRLFHPSASIISPSLLHKQREKSICGAFAYTTMLGLTSALLRERFVANDAYFV